MLILGIDPGYARTGWGLIKKEGSSCKLVKYSCFETKANTPAAQRLTQIFDHITNLCRIWNIDMSAIEDLFFNTNAKTAIRVGEARGVILVALEQQQIPVFHYTPLQIKTAITSYGRADKLQVQKMVTRLLHLDHIPQPDDAADALAVALTHAFTHKSP